MKHLHFRGKTAKAGERLIITVPTAMHHLFTKGTKVKVFKSKS